MRFDLTTLTFARLCSTPELRPRPLGDGHMADSYRPCKRGFWPDAPGKHPYPIRISSVSHLYIQQVDRVAPGRRNAGLKPGLRVPYVVVRSGQRPTWRAHGDCFPSGVVSKEQATSRLEAVF